jgi:ADP-ribose diphosphatase
MATNPEQRYVRLVAESNLFRIETIGLRFTNGTEVEFERLTPGHGGGAVLVVPVTEDGRILMIREYAVGTNRYELGLPKGRLEVGEVPETGARRELREEVGYDAARVDRLRQVTLAPGYIAHQTTIILARELNHAPLVGDEPEVIEVVPWPLSGFDDLMARGDLTEARSITALYLTRAFLENDKGGSR